MYCRYISTLNKLSTLFTYRLARYLLGQVKNYKLKSLNLLLIYAVPFVDYFYKAEHSSRAV